MQIIVLDLHTVIGNLHAVINVIGDLHENIPELHVYARSLRRELLHILYVTYFFL